MGKHARVSTYLALGGNQTALSLSIECSTNSRRSFSATKRSPISLEFGSDLLGRSERWRWTAWQSKDFIPPVCNWQQQADPLAKLERKSGPKQEQPLPHQ